jgi:hypothetical protein
MFERIKIKYLGRQPAANISDRTLDRLIRREFPDNFKEVKHKLDLIRSHSIKGRNRLSASVLKLSNKDLMKMDSFIEMCNHDFRDVLSQAEYPERAKYGFEKITLVKLKKIYLEDWSAYSNWISRV